MVAHICPSIHSEHHMCLDLDRHEDQVGCLACVGMCGEHCTTFHDKSAGTFRRGKKSIGKGRALKAQVMELSE